MSTGKLELIRKIKTHKQGCKKFTLNQLTNMTIQELKQAWQECKYKI